MPFFKGHLWHHPYLYWPFHKHPSAFFVQDGAHGRYEAKLRFEYSLGFCLLVDERNPHRTSSTVDPFHPTFYWHLRTSPYSPIYLIPTSRHQPTSRIAYRHKNLAFL